MTKLKLWEKNTQTQNVTNLKLWQNWRTQIVTKLKNSNVDKTWNMTNFNLRRRKKTLKASFSKNILTPWQPMGCSLGSVLQFSRCFQCRPAAANTAKKTALVQSAEAASCAISVVFCVIKDKGCSQICQRPKGVGGGGGGVHNADINCQGGMGADYLWKHG